MKRDFQVAMLQQIFYTFNLFILEPIKQAATDSFATNIIFNFSKM